jgi:hypothetical protein
VAAFGCALALPGVANAAYSIGVHPDEVLEGWFTSCPAGCTIVQKAALVTASVKTLASSGSG